MQAESELAGAGALPACNARYALSRFCTLSQLLLRLLLLVKVLDELKRVSERIQQTQCAWSSS